MAGPISGSTVVEVVTPPGVDRTLYRVEFLQVAGEDFALRDLTAYGTAISR